MLQLKPLYSRVRLCSLQNQFYLLDAKLAEATLQLEQLQRVAGQKQPNPVTQLLESQRQTRTFFGEQLIKGQIEVLRSEQKKQLVSRYQKRIQYLRGILIHKEVDLNFTGEEICREPLKKHNLQRINTLSAEQVNMVNRVREKKILEVEISALKHTLASIHNGNTVKQQTQLEDTCMKEIWGLEGVLGKAAKALLAQESKHNNLLSKALNLQKELEELQEVRKELKEDYQSLGGQKKKAEICSGLKILPKELSESQSPPGKLASIQINRLSSPAKSKVKVISLREHNSKKSKQN